MNYRGQNRTRGLVMKIAGGHAVVATPDMQFHRVHLSQLGGARVGDEVWFRPAAAPDLRLTRRRIAAAVAVCLAASFLFFVLSVPLLRGLRADSVPVAHLVVDINPSLEMAVARGGQVIDAWGLNARGREMVNRIQWRNRHMLEVLEALVAEAASSGYLDFTDLDGTILISLIASDPDQDLEGFPLAGEITQFLTQYLGATLGEGPQPLVHVWDVGLDERQAADDLDMSPNRYLVLKGLETAGIEVEPEEIRDQPLGHVIRDKVSPQGISVPDFIKGRDNRPGPPDWVPGPPIDTPGKGEPGPPDETPGKGEPGPPDNTPGKGEPGPPDETPGKGEPGPPDRSDRGWGPPDRLPGPPDEIPGKGEPGKPPPKEHDKK